MSLNTVLGTIMEVHSSWPELEHGNLRLQRWFSFTRDCDKNSLENFHCHNKPQQFLLPLVLQTLWKTDAMTFPQQSCMKVSSDIGKLRQHSRNPRCATPQRTLKAANLTDRSFPIHSQQNSPTSVLLLDVSDIPFHWGFTVPSWYFIPQLLHPNLENTNVPAKFPKNSITGNM